MTRTRSRAGWRSPGTSARPVICLWFLIRGALGIIRPALRLRGRVSVVPRGVVMSLSQLERASLLTNVSSRLKERARIQSAYYA